MIMCLLIEGRFLPCHRDQEGGDAAFPRDGSHIFNKDILGMQSREEIMRRFTSQEKKKKNKNIIASSLKSDSSSSDIMSL